VTIGTTVVRNTTPASNPAIGRAIEIQLEPASGARSSVEIRSTILEQNTGGLAAFGSDVLIDGCVVRGTAGRSIAVQGQASVRATGTIRSVLVEGSIAAGVVLDAADLTIEGSVVRDTAATTDALFGDGIAAILFEGKPSLSVTHVLVDVSERAGISNFGGDVAIASTTVRCSAFDLNGEAFGGEPFAFQDLGDNHCGCPEATERCAAKSSGLAPPEPVEGGASAP